MRWGCATCPRGVKDWGDGKWLSFTPWSYIPTAYPLGSVCAVGVLHILVVAAWACLRNLPAFIGERTLDVSYRSSTFVNRSLRRGQIKSFTGPRNRM